MICSLTMTSPDRKNVSPKTENAFSGCLSHLDIERLEILNKLFKLANPVPEVGCFIYLFIYFFYNYKLLSEWKSWRSKLKVI